jgi:hypothetical protein
MARPAEIAGRKFISKREVAVRYDVTTRSIDRWVKAKLLPASDLVINHRHYWLEAGLDRHDRRSVAERAAAKSQPAPNPIP